MAVHLLQRSVGHSSSNEEIVFLLLERLVSDYDTSKSGSWATDLIDLLFTFFFFFFSSVDRVDFFFFTRLTVVGLFPEKI